tara:strand:- start:298 stop:648 length:351 start_codon:yes stop_codon:yes gene_type:complete
MIVKNNGEEMHTLFEKGKEYVVLSIEFNDGIPFVRILAEDAQPRLMRMEEFDIISGEIDPSWQVVLAGGRVCVGPPSWYNPGFWQAYFDDEPGEKSVFLKISEKIISRGAERKAID